MGGLENDPSGSSHPQRSASWAALAATRDVWWDRQRAVCDRRGQVRKRPPLHVSFLVAFNIGRVLTTPSSAPRSGLWHPASGRVWWRRPRSRCARGGRHRRDGFRTAPHRQPEGPGRLRATGRGHMEARLRAGKAPLAFGILAARHAAREGGGSYLRNGLQRNRPRLRGHPFRGALSMAAFGAGTLPAMLAGSRRRRPAARARASRGRTARPAVVGRRAAGRRHHPLRGGCTPNSTNHRSTCCTHMPATEEPTESIMPKLRWQSICCRESDRPERQERRAHRAGTRASFASGSPPRAARHLARRKDDWRGAGSARARRDWRRDRDGGRRDVPRGRIGPPDEPVARDGRPRDAPYRHRERPGKELRPRGVARARLPRTGVIVRGHETRRRGEPRGRHGRAFLRFGEGALAPASSRRETRTAASSPGSARCRRSTATTRCTRERSLRTFLESYVIDDTIRATAVLDGQTVELEE